MRPRPSGRVGVNRATGREAEAAAQGGSSEAQVPAEAWEAQGALENPCKVDPGKEARALTLP